ncbi:MAG TPA: alpha/beta hydrolase [Solirubrobacteraceae bacterium]|nr:alpha/beta hydrolase [Solirubrobacteraceae bacterium]
MSAIEFQSAGVACRGIHLEGSGEAFARDGRRPCVVLAHGFAGTVDSGLVPFAERFAAAGLDALAFDYRHFGASDGEPRQLLSVKRQLEDYAAAIARARSLEGVDPARVVLWGYSFAGGHVVAAAVADGRIAAVISQLPFMDGLANTLMLARQAGPGQLARLTLAGLRDRLAALRGAPPVTVPAVGAPGTLAMMSTPDAEPGMRAIAGPSWRNEVAARIGLTLGTYRPGAQTERLPCPILVQIADRDAIVPGKAAEDAAFRATGRAEVRTYPIGHFDVCDGEPFERAVADQLHFLRRHLGAGAEPAEGEPAGAAAASA